MANGSMVKEANKKFSLKVIKKIAWKLFWKLVNWVMIKAWLDSDRACNSFEWLIDEVVWIMASWGSFKNFLIRRSILCCPGNSFRISRTLGTFGNFRETVIQYQKLNLRTSKRGEMESNSRTLLIAFIDCLWPSKETAIDAIAFMYFEDFAGSEWIGLHTAVRSERANKCCDRRFIFIIHGSEL